jgi:hypothetical protein
VAGAARADNPTLVGTVGTDDAFVISLTDAAGAKVAHLDPGTYTLVVHDRSELHNFHLFGPGNVNVSTDVDFVGDKTFTVTLVDGVYHFDCDPHATVMKGAFTVGNATLPATKLTASVGPGRRIALRNASGSSVSFVDAGPVVLTVRDRSRTDNFHLTGPGVNVATGVGFRGTKTWQLTLRAGSYTYRSDRHRALRGGFSAG